MIAPPVYDIGASVFVVLAPGMYEGQSPGVAPDKYYIFEMRVGGFRFENTVGSWKYEVYNAVGTFWTFYEYLCDDQKHAVNVVRSCVEGRKK